MTEILDEGAVSEVQRRANAATAGPWDWSYHPRTANFPNDVMALQSESLNKDVLLCTGDSDISWGEISESDAAFIKHAREDIPALCATVKHLRANPRQVWEEHPNRDGSGKKCTECEFDNRFHAYECFFHHPSLKISEDAFNALHDEKMQLQSQLEQLRAENERLRELVRHMQFPRGE